ncbi:MAG: DUF134 domain-containing protein [Bacillota bacterium]
MKKKKVIKMPRPVKMRRICQLPAFSLYGPLSKKGNEDQFITMQVEEFEAIRLMDLEGLDQEQCAEKMNVARSTVQRIYCKSSNQYLLNPQDLVKI